jgi:hypothetical protein
MRASSARTSCSPATCVDLGHALAEQLLGVPAGAQALVADGQQRADLAQTQADPLGALDEPQPLDGVGAVLAVAGRGSGLALAAGPGARSSARCRR